MGERDAESSRVASRDAGLAVRVRRGLPEDAEGIATLLSAVSRESPFLGAVGISPSVEHLRVLLRPGETRIVVVVAASAEAPSRVVGYAHAVAGLASTMRHVGTVAVAVDAAFRGQGIGTRLLKRLVDEGQKLGWVRLRASVWANNAGSRRLFEQVGFRQDARIPEQLMDQDGRLVDEIVYGYRLRGAVQAR
ncbi:MAG: GNAT family N-acetyltransferase [Actinomycetia bacterium]|nr:GNAT family N-acetyltransferase [Actinomycetes bacterium]